MYLENKSSKRTYAFAALEAAINGVEVEPLLDVQVAPGEKTNSEIAFTEAALEEIGITIFSDIAENGITDLTDIELSIWVFDNDDEGWDAADVEGAHVYPYGKENATKFVRETQDTDEVIIDNEYATL